METELHELSHLISGSTNRKENHKTRSGMKFTILDVGSGTNPDCNVFLKGENIVHMDINVHAYHLEALATIYQLPFKDRSFPIVHASHILEHLDNPLKGLLELKRVSQSSVVIIVPNAVYYRTSYESPEHIFSWNESTLGHLLKRVFNHVRIINSHRITDWERKSKLRTLKRLVLTALLKNNELAAICKT